MIQCPNCGEPYRVLTSRAVSTEIREYHCHCKYCDVRFRQFGVFEGFIVENQDYQPPSEELQPALVRQSVRLMKSLNPPVVEKPKEDTGMVFVNGR